MLLLNHLPISFSSQQFSGFSLPYQGKEHFKELHNNLDNTHFVLRNGENILLFPYENNTETEGKETTFDIVNNHQIAGALARNALLQSFIRHNRRLTSIYPIKFINTQNLLDDKYANIFSIFPEYGFDIRPIVPQEKTFIQGVIVSFASKLFISPNVAELLKYNINPEGLYIVTDNPESSSLIQPMFSRQLIGYIKQIKGDAAILADQRQGYETVSLDQIYIEPSRHNFERIAKQLYGNQYSQFQKEILKKLSEVFLTEKQSDRIIRIHKKFKDLQGSLSCCNNLSIKLAGCQTVIEQGIGVGKYRKLTSPSCSLRPGGSITVPWPIDKKIDINGPFDSDKTDGKNLRIGVIFPEQYKGHVEKFAAELRDGVPSSGNDFLPFQQGMVRKYRLQSLVFEFFNIDISVNEKSKAYKDASLAAATKNVNATIIVVTDEDKLLTGENNPYFVSKALLLSQGIPVQAIRLNTLIESNPWSLNNFALSLYAKLGGIPWTLSVQQRLVNEIIIGIGSTQIGFDRLSKRERLIGITTVFSGDGNYLLGNVTTEAPYDDYQESLLTSLQSTLSELQRRFAWCKGDKVRIIFHQSFKKYKNKEAEAVEKLIKTLDGYNVEYAFVQVSEEHNWRLFDPSSQGAGYRNNKKGIAVPQRGQIIPIGPYTALLTLIGPEQLKTDMQGCPTPILINIHQNSTFTDLSYISEQIYKLTFMSWRSFTPSTKPVSIMYPNMVVDLLANLRQIPNFNSDILATKLRESRWFL